MEKKVKLPRGYRPSQDEPFMGPRQREYFRLRLEAWREEVARGTERTRERLREGAWRPNADLGDVAWRETDRGLELRTREREKGLVAKIDAALRRLQDGTYGYCEETGEPIELERLEARPVATLVLREQERREEEERVHGK